MLNSPPGVIEAHAPEWLELKALIGVGGMGRVYEALDKRSGETIAVKTLANFGGKQLLYLKNEFRSFAGVVHPNLVSQYELVEHGGQWFLLMELLTGAELLYGLRGQTAPTRMHTPISESNTSSAPIRATVGTIDADRTRTLSGLKAVLADEEATQPAEAVGRILARRVLTAAELMQAMPVLRQVALAIDAIHRSGYLHRDVKPSNIVVTPEGRAVLLDFGIAVAKQSAKTETEGNDLVAGTPAYLAPELLRGAPPSTASDWFAFGTTLFEALTGARPWPGKALYRAKVDSAPVKVKELAPHIPAQLSELIARLLLPDPESRPVFDEIFAVLGGRRGDAGISTSRENTLVVGRHEERGRLRALAAQARQQPTSIFLRGRSGVGKSALLGDVLAELESSGCLVLNGRCYEQEIVPYKTVDKVVDALTNVLDRKAEWAKAVKPLDVVALTRAFSVLSSVFPSSEAQVRSLGNDAADLQARAIRALTEVLQQLARIIPLVVCVDDLQWGDAVGAQVLAKLSAPGGPPVFVIGGFRAEDAASPNLQALFDLFRRETGVDAEVMSIEPLSRQESEALAASIAAEVDVTQSTLIEWALSESEGQPFFLQQLIYAVALNPSLATSGSGRGLQDVVATRVAQLPDEARAVLEAVSLAGSMVPLDVITQAANVSHASRAYQQLRAGHFIRTARSDDRDWVDTYHDKFREVVRGRLQPERSKVVHAQLLNAWQRDPGLGSNRLFALAHHAQLAAEEVPAPLALSVLLAAADEAVASFDSMRAREFLLGAQVASARQGQLLDARHERMLGDVSLLCDDLEGAKAAYERVLQTSTVALERAGAHAGLSRLFMASLNTRQAFAEANRALEAIRLPLVTPSFASLVGGFFRLLVTALRVQLFGASKERSTDVFESTTYAMSGFSGYFLFDKRLLLGSVLRGFSSVSRLAAHPLAVEWYALVSVTASVAGLRGLARALQRYARKLADTLNDPTSKSHLAAYESLAIDMGGEPVKAEKLALEVIKTGRIDVANYLTLVGGSTWNVLMRGHVRQAKLFVDHGARRVESTGASLMARGHTFRSYFGTIYALLGRPEEGQQHLDAYAAFLAKHAPGDVFREILLLGHQALVLHLGGASDAELEACFTKHDAYRISPSNHVQTLRHIYLAKALRRGDQVVAQPKHTELIDDARALVKTLKRFGAHPTIGLHRQLLEAKLAWAGGEDPRPRLEALCAAAKNLEAPWLLIEASLALALHARSMGDAASVEPQLKTIEAVASEHGLVALLERTKRLLEQQRGP